MHNLATEIFYSKNTFQIHSYDEFEHDPLYQAHLDFLKGIPSNSLPFLRSLHLVFWIQILDTEEYFEENMVGPDGDAESFERVLYMPPSEGDDTRTNATEEDNIGGRTGRRKVGDIRIKDERDWEMAIRFMAQHLDLPRLKLRLSDDGRKRDCWGGQQDPRNAEYCRIELRYYRMLFWKVRRLKDRGLRKFFIHLPCKRGYDTPRNKLEDGLEEMVMRENYDGVKEAKFGTDPNGTPKYTLWY